MSETETTSATPKETPTETTPPVPAPAPSTPVAPRPPRSAWPVVFTLGFLVLGAGEGYLWYNQQGHQADATQLAVLRTQMDDMRTEASRTAPAPNSVVAQADLAQKYAALAAQVNAMQTQEAADHGQISQMQANATDLGQLTTRIALLNALETARMALDAGLPLGTIPNAPDALGQFSTSAPPTEAALRQSFPAAAKAAEAASLSPNGKVGFWDQVKLRLEGIITISNGDTVLFGPPAAALLNQAETALAAGDLAGAVAKLQALSPASQAAMAGWLAQAKALLDARAALMTMAQGT
ncbi:hypothetical protein [Acidocella aromatica]|uniref:Uncharacterized protein n=1 Tax=Acidocella aromatica TaxID=1303579 RepID=A0A840VG20_9PROT|nr:hypothetical protein [Acidocella aromatica]MBB5373837.1 hypothetical protein [Acidocella aromatica]